MKNKPDSQQLTIQQAISRAKQATKQGNTAVAVNLYNAILQQQPNHPIAKKGLHKLQKTTRDNQVLKGKTANPPPNQINALIDLYKTGQMSKTEEACRKMLQTYPQALVAINVLGAVLVTQMKFHEAVESFEKVIQLKPDSTEAYLNLASALKELGRPRDAVKNCRKAIQLRPDFAEAYFVLGTALRELEQTPEAIESYKKGLQLKPEFPEACKALGTIYIEQGLLEKGLRMVRRADHVICFDPNNGVSVLRGN